MKFEQGSRRRRISTTVVALLFAVGAVPLALLGAFLSQRSRDDLEVQQQHYQLVLAEAIAREIGDFVAAKRGAVRSFARDIEAATGVIGSDQAIAEIQQRQLLKRRLEDDGDLAQLLLAVPAGSEPPHAQRVRYVVASRPDSGTYAAALDVLVSRLLDRAFRGMESLESPPGESPVLVIVSPVRGRDSVLALAALVSLEGLHDRLVARGEELYLIYLTDREGRRLFARSRDDGGRPALLSSDLVSAFREGGGTRTMPFRANIDGHDSAMVGAFATVLDTGWGVFVEVDADTAYYAVRRMRQTTAIWTAGSILLALILGGLFARQIVQPIRALASGAARLAKGDFSRPIELESGNEIGLLADSFNHMADEIRQQIVQLESAASENKELFLASIRMLAEAIDEKDPYTRGHSERVARYAVAVARALNVSASELEKVQIGALLHDVGKIGIDDRILRKPTVLTDAEFEIMKQHPEKGAHIMSAVGQLQHIIPGMRFHHEKVDGTGYPLGLKGDEIPLAAQIISVSDTFDAMTTDRPYQRGMDPVFVVEKLKGWIGNRFRADVVEAFEQAYVAGDISLTKRPHGRPGEGAEPSRS